ncbi:MAG: exodeoxyribonuclease V subunit alpha [Cocleimonas sp.]|nr:exodeoxyribonuclease V subunit alpha [Cocleimonas sp.]
MKTTPAIEVPEYEALDYQLANLLEQLNNEKNKTLRKVTLAISKKTREGHIALACDHALAEELLANKVVGMGEDYTPLTLDNNYIYLHRYWSYQQRLADQISARLSFTVDKEQDREWIKQRLAHYFSQDNDGSDINWQQTAAALALISRFLIISGGPGTGKTTTITRILALLIEQHQRTNHQPLRFSLAAPTGKAAMRMSESIRESITREGDKLSDEIKQQLPQESSTIHRLLGYIPNSTEFRFNKNNHLATDIVIVDEASMIDLALMTKLFEATPPQASIILLGDKDQLASVETGSVFTDLCLLADNQYSEILSNYLQEMIGHTLDAEQIKTKLAPIDNHILCLLKSWRFDQTSGIGILASAVNQGKTKDAINALEDSSVRDIQLILPVEFTTNQLLSPWQHYLQALKTNTSIDDLFAAFNQFRILSALRKGMNGSTYLNLQLEKLFSQKKQLYTGKRWYHGRPIMITENSYRTGLFNGDIGITLIERGQTQVWFKTNEGIKPFSPVRLPQHETAWVMTIHKSQGSEFKRVLIILPTEDTPVLTRQLIYTGITRAKKKLDIISSSTILELGIKREIPQATQIRSALR